MLIEKYVIWLNFSLTNASVFGSYQVLKNTEREAPEKSVEKVDKFEGGAIKKSKEVVRSKEKMKEKLVKEKPKKSFTEKKATEQNDSSIESNNVKKNPRQAVKEETVHKENTSSSTSNKTEEDQCKLNEGNTIEKDKERKIRNKDRPAIQIYRPGSKRLTTQKQVVSVFYFLSVFHSSSTFLLSFIFLNIRNLGAQKRQQKPNGN